MMMMILREFDKANKALYEKIFTAVLYMAKWEKQEAI